MKRVLSICVVCLISSQGQAQEDPGQSLMERGAELFLEGLRHEMEPALDDLLGLADQFGPAMQSFFQEMGPALADLASEVQDWSVYEMPEILPNGDIIIRKKPEIEDPVEPEIQQDEPSEGVTDI